MGLLMGMSKFYIALYSYDRFSQNYGSDHTFIYSIQIYYLLYKQLSWSATGGNKIIQLW